jgi:hypothetical protein
MSHHAAGPDAAQVHVELRRARLLDSIRRPVRDLESTSPIPRYRIEHLVKDAEELYWNELSWEEITDEERVAGGHLTELVFPGFLSFVDALVHQDRWRADGECFRPDVVEEVLLFLGERYSFLTAELEGGADSQRVVWARAMTAHLTDLVLYRLYALSPEERERIEGS